VAVRIRDRLARELGDEYASLLELFGEVRPRIMASGRSFRDRRSLWYDLVDGPAIELLRAGDQGEARAIVDATIAAWEAAA
jgi:uroporphyrin-III C-methyltransferase/precorrin-2 dehydrogenase/sirohydrochlorin ferrochelatase/precorrin-2 dehydrogenase/sirohydrochlorin ferrochelatase